VVIALDHGRDRAEAAHRRRIQLPHRVRHRMIVGIHQVVAVILVACEVNLLHALGGDGVQVLERVELMVHRAHVDVVDIEQDQAIGTLRDLGEKLPFAETRIAKFHVARHVLEQDAPAEEVLHAAHPLDDVRERLFGVRQRQQVVRIASGDTRPAEMIRDPRRLDALRERLQLSQVLAIERRAAADRERHAVQRERIALADPREMVQWRAAGNQVVLGQRLEPVDRRACG